MEKVYKYSIHKSIINIYIYKYSIHQNIINNNYQDPARPKMALLSQFLLLFKPTNLNQEIPCIMFYDDSTRATFVRHVSSPDAFACNG